MSRRSRNLPIEVRDEENLPAPIQDALDYHPTDEMLKLRAEYFTLCEANPLDTREPRDKIAEYFPQYKANQIIRLMERNPAFENWFQADHEFDAKLKYLADKSLQALQDLLTSDHPAMATAKVKAAQIVLTLAGKQPKQKGESEDTLMKALSKMDAAQCQAMLAGGTEVKVSVKRHDTLDVNKEPEND